LKPRPPDIQTRQRIVNLSLNQQALRLRDIVDRRQPRLVARGRLL